MRKILITLLTFVMLVSASMFCFTACDFSGSSKDYEGTEGLVFEENSDGTAFIVTSVDTEETTVTIPDEYDGLPVTTIGADAFRGQLYIKEVVLPDSVIEIERSAFNGCVKLEKINLENVKIIGEDAFKNAFTDSSIQITTTFPKVTMSSLQSIGKNAFSGCLKLREVDMTGAPLNNISESCFSGCDGLYTVKLSQNTKTVHKNAFMGGKSLTNINLNYVEYFKVSCFEGCANLKNIVLTNCVDIRDRAFYECKKLGTVTIGNKAERIYVRAFKSIPLSTFTVGNALEFVSYYFENYYATNNGGFNAQFPKLGVLVSDDNPEGRPDKTKPEDWAVLMRENQNQGCFVCTQKWLDDNGYKIGDKVAHGVIFNQP